MPPRKRKAQDTDTEQDESQASTSAKKLKKSGTLDSLPHNGQPANRALPIKIDFEKRAEGTLRIAAWNVCGFAASSKKACHIPVHTTF
jgi:AP endonuclease 1